MGQIENINTEINIYGEAVKFKKMICLMEEQLFLYRMYTNRIDWSLFSEFEYTNRDKLMPIRGSLSVEKAKKLLGYKPEYNIEKGFNDYITWYQER